MGCCMSDTRGGGQSVGGLRSDRFFTQSLPNDAVQHFFESRGCHSLSSQLQISLAARDLRDRDVLSKSDPMAVVYERETDRSLREIGRTEVVLNSLDPVWVLKPLISYQFEIRQPLLFKVYDVDTKFYDLPVENISLDQQDIIGEAECFLSEIVTKPGKKLILPLRKSSMQRMTDTGAESKVRKNGELIVEVTETANSKTVVEMILRCSDLQNKDLFSKSDPFLKIFKQTDSGIVPLYKTEVKKNDLHPTWKTISLSMEQVGRKDSMLKIICYNFNNSGNHECLGMIEKTLDDLAMLNEKKTGENLYLQTSSGSATKILKAQLHVEYFSISTKPSFLDYLANGYELNFMVAIDFTASNGNPRLPDSLHYMDPTGRFNAYQQAICCVGEVLEFYDHDKRFTALGFGGRPIDGPVSHCFNLNGSSSNAEVVGVNGILSAYSNALHNVALAGPTLFGHVINYAAQIAHRHLEQQKYFVLLIITDGVITDIQETKDAIVKASDLPLSILIVGVGGADFKEMEILDADNGQPLESSNGQIATRDIVQFVPMRNLPIDAVVRSLLAELPFQFLSFMKSRRM
eukprot:TRINITY_DN13459_c0_g1_i1.p1 TRINITY_DN13459_c0_g1~~TRINITY_DN13459_c0_g1_i1.p1  ORF type:complete len:575 (-),score=116.29 TRINITY_DN13459_c0_g1_i1:411-2135(-)